MTTLSIVHVVFFSHKLRHAAPRHSTRSRKCAPAQRGKKKHKKWLVPSVTSQPCSTHLIGMIWSCRVWSGSWSSTSGDVVPPSGRDGHVAFKVRSLFFVPHRTAPNAPNERCEECGEGANDSTRMTLAMQWCPVVNENSLFDYVFYFMLSST